MMNDDEIRKPPSAEQIALAKEAVDTLLNVVQNMGKAISTMNKRLKRIEDVVIPKQDKSPGKVTINKARYTLRGEQIGFWGGDKPDEPN